MQNRSIGVNVVCEGSPSRILSVLLISLGITIRPRSSTLLTMPVAFIYLSPLQMSQAPKAPLCKGGWQKSLISDWGIVMYRQKPIPPSRLRRATSLYTREAFRPTIILQITMLLFVRQGDLYERIFRFFHLLSECEKSQIPRPISLISPEKQSIIFLNKPEVPRFRIVTSSQKSQGNVCYTPIRKIQNKEICFYVF